jgi:hypothetical protein
LAVSVFQPSLDADARLRRKAEVGFSEKAVDFLTNVRDAFGPGPKGWWFDIGDLATAQIERRAWFWTAFAGLCLTLSASSGATAIAWASSSLYAWMVRTSRHVDVDQRTRPWLIV